MADELDDIPRRRRARMFTIAAWFNGGVASVLLVALLRCQSLWRQDLDAKWNERLKDWQNRFEQTGQKQIEAAEQRFDPTINETQRKIDSLQMRLDTLKTKRS